MHPDNKSDTDSGVGLLARMIIWVRRAQRLQCLHGAPFHYQYQSYTDTTELVTLVAIGHTSTLSSAERGVVFHGINNAGALDPN